MLTLRGNVFATKVPGSLWVSQVAQQQRICLPAQEMQETQVRSLGWADPLEKEMAIHFSILAWKSHGQRGLVGYSLRGSTELDMTEHAHMVKLSR